MNTWSHVLINTVSIDALNRRRAFRKTQRRQVPLRWLLLGSLIPDMPLLVLTIWYVVTHGLEFEPLYDQLFYNDPIWVISHNLFHAPLLVGAGVLVALIAGRYLERGGMPVANAAPRTESAGGISADTHTALSQASLRRLQAIFGALFAFCLGCLMHTILDVVTHHDDGPLLLFPFDWSLRFSSPISYWDPDHYGGIFAPIELGLDLVLIGYWLLAWRRRRGAGRTG